MRIVSAVGARPDFVKIDPILRAVEQAERPGLEVRLVHTGQHHDFALSDPFLENLGIRPSDLLLGVGSGTHASQAFPDIWSFCA